MKRYLFGVLGMMCFISPKVYADTQLRCVAEAVYREARGATPRDRWAVARTIYNRTQHPTDFAKTPCGVVKQHTRHVRQFSWSKHFLIHHKEPLLYQEALRIAERVRRTPARGCEKDILFFATPHTSVGVPTHVCLAGKMTFRVPVHKAHKTHATQIATTKHTRRRYV